MDPEKLFVDKRLSNMCVYCGAWPDTVDHVPSKVLLDEPFPPNLPVVQACESCNHSFSLDEQYLACFLECIIAGSVSHDRIGREKIKRILKESPRLVKVIEKCRQIDAAGNTLWSPNYDRVKNVVLKLARGHAAYECGEARFDEPAHLMIAPLCTMSPEEVHEFNSPPIEQIWPEIGSRAFMRTVGVGSSAYLDEGWQIIQPTRYRYLVSDSGCLVRVVLSEYLACEATW